MPRKVKNKNPLTSLKQPKHRPSSKILNHTPSKPQSTSKEKILFSDNSQTFSPSTNHKQTFNPSHIGIDLKKQAIITQNIPFALPVPNISKLYITANISLLIFYIIMAVISSQRLKNVFKTDQQTIPLITVVCMTLVMYVIYALMTIKCSCIRAFSKKMIGIKEFETFFYEMKTAKTWFKVELMGDRAKWSQKDEIRQLIYEPKIVDQSGRFYPLPEVISYCNTNNHTHKTTQTSKYSDQEIVYGPEKAGETSTLEAEPLITIVLASYEKKYYFANDMSKMSYLNRIQQFFSENQRMFDPRKPIKGYKSMEFLVEGFQEKKAYLMVTLPQKHNTLKPKNKILIDKQNDSLHKLQNDSFIMVSDPNSLVVLDDDEIRQQKMGRIQEGLIYKNKPQAIFDEMKEEIISQQNQKDLKETGSVNEKDFSYKKEMNDDANLEYRKEEGKYVGIFWVSYWVFLIMGLGAFYEWVILRRYVKCIQVTVTKEIHQESDSIKGLSEDQKIFQE